MILNCKIDNCKGQIQLAIIDENDSYYRCNDCYSEYNPTEIINIMTNQKDWEY